MNSNTLPGLPPAPPRDTSVAAAASRAARDAKALQDRAKWLRYNLLVELRRRGPMPFTRISDMWCTCEIPKAVLKAALAELQREGRIVHGNAGWSVK